MVVEWLYEQFTQIYSAHVLWMRPI